MNIAPIVGLLGAFAFISLAVDDINGLIEPSSIGLVVGGTFMVVLFRSTLDELFAGFSAAARVFIHKAEELEVLIDTIVGLAIVVRKDGMMALERISIENHFLAAGLRPLVDGADSVFIKSSLEREMNMVAKRHQAGSSIFNAAGEISPAMGMIGTLIGLVNLLSNLSDPAGIGSAMAVALLTTLYGAILANVVFIPMAMKLEGYAIKEELNNQLISEGILLIKANANPRVIEDVLNVYLSPKKKNAEPTGKDEEFAAD
jgi:chemotaxis protein MotA